MASEWIFSEDELRNTPSRRDGMKQRDELLQRRKGCVLIERLATPLALPKLASATAQCYFHRFFMRQSLVRFDKYLVAAACVLLSTKTEETPVKLSTLTTEYISVRKQVEKEGVFAIQKHDAQVLATRIVSMEHIVLHALAYEMTATHPYKFINEQVERVVRRLQLQEESAKNRLKQAAWSFLNDSLYTPACLRAEPEDLAAAAVYLAGLYEDTVAEVGWWEVLSTPLHLLQDAATYLLAVYADPYIDTQVLPAPLAKLVFMFHDPLQNVVESPRDVEAVATGIPASPKTIVSSPLSVSGLDWAGCSPVDFETEDKSVSKKRPLIETQSSDRAVRVCRW